MNNNFTNYNKRLNSFYQVIKRDRYAGVPDIRAFQPGITATINKARSIIYYYYIKNPWDRKALRQLIRIQIDKAVDRIETHMSSAYAKAFREKIEHLNILGIATKGGYDKALQMLYDEIKSIQFDKEDYLNKQTDITREGDVINKQQVAVKYNVGNLETYENLKGVASSWIQGLRYEHTTQQLWIRAHNRWYIWVKIPERIYEESLNPSKIAFGSTYSKIKGKGSGSGIGTAMWKTGIFFKNPELGQALLTTVAKGKKWTEKKREKVEKWAIAQINKSWRKRRREMIGVLKAEAKKNVDYTGFVFSDVLGSDFHVSDTRMDVIRPTKSVLKTWQRQNLRSYYRDIELRKTNIKQLKTAKINAKKDISLKVKNARKQYGKKNLKREIRKRVKYKKTQIRSQAWAKYNQGKLDPRKILKKMGVKLKR